MSKLLLVICGFVIEGEEGKLEVALLWGVGLTGADCLMTRFEVRKKLGCCWGDELGSFAERRIRRI